MLFSPGVESKEDPRIKVERESLETAFTAALRAVFPSFSSEDARAEFYALYKRESEEYDKDFIKRYDEDLNTSLIFAGLFSAVSSAFIIDVQSDLKPDFNKATAILIRLLINKIDNTSFSDVDLSALQWTGASPILVDVQTLLYASLAVSLLSAFLAMLGKQWLNRYEQVERRGSLVDRSHHRQIKLDGIAAWGFSWVMEGLPLMLQAGLLLFGCALSRYLWIIDHTVATMLVGVTSFGVIFYLFIVISATLSYNCPFQTPASVLLRNLINYDHEHRQYLRRAGCLVSSIYCWMRDAKNPLLYLIKRAPALEGQKGDEEVELLGAVDVVSDLHPFVYEGKELEWGSYASDARCITWMLEASTDQDVAISAMRMIPEVEWHPEIDVMPSLVQLHDSVNACLDLTGRWPSIVMGMRNKAYAATKAFLHLLVQRSCIAVDHLPLVALRAQHRPFGSHIGQFDNDLKSLLWMMDHIIQGSKDILWCQPQFSPSHTSWLCHILVYHLWQLNKNPDSRRGAIPEGLYQLLEQALSSQPLPHQSTVTDCLLILGLTIGIHVESEELWIADKSSACANVTQRLYDGLNRVFQRPTSARRVERSLNALRVLACWQKQSNTDTEQHQRLSYVLSQAIIGSTVEENVRWEASRLALQIGFRNTDAAGICGDPVIALAFIEHHFHLENRGESHPESLADAFIALSHSPYLNNFRLGQGPFLRGLFSALDPSKPIRLRRAAILFVDWIGDQIFDSKLESLMDDEQRAQLCSYLSTVTSQLEDGETAVNSCLFSLLLRMAYSRMWRPHLHIELWTTIYQLSSRCTDVPVLMRQCLNESDIIHSLRRSEEWQALALWMKVIWIRYDLLDDGVQDVVVQITLDLFRREGFDVVEEFRALVEKEQNEVEKVIRRTASWDSSLLKTMRARLDTLKQKGDTMQSIWDSVEKAKILEKPGHGGP